MFVADKSNFISTQSLKLKLQQKFHWTKVYFPGGAAIAVAFGKAPAGNAGVGPVVLSHPGAPGLRSEVNLNE